MTQKDLILKYHEKQMSPTQIHDKLVDIFEEKALSVSTVSRTIRQLSWSSSNDHQKNPPGRPPNPSYDRLILQELRDDETVSCRQIARSTKIPYSSVNYALHTRLHYKPVNVQYVPHILTEQNKIQRVEYCKELLPILQKCKKRNYRFIITGDESWILYFTPNGCIWLQEGDPIPNAVRGGFQIPKVLLAIFWNTFGIASIHVLRNGETMNSNKFINNVLKPIEKNHCFIQAKKQKQKFYIHFDNCPSHKAKCVSEYLAQKKFSIAPHPAYSPDLSPSDFYLFGRLKDKLEGIEFQSENEIEQAIIEEFEKISSEELKTVFDSWIQRIEKCIEIGGSYVE